MATTVTKGQEILPLTSLRFFAAAHVVLFHTWSIFLPSLPGPRLWNMFISIGYSGVSTFFILSGYILALVYLGSSGAAPLRRKKFWVARLARVYPLYATSLLVFTPFVYLGLRSLSPAHRAARLAFLAFTNFTMVQAWRPAFGGGWNVPTWSVSAEAFFYLAFPFAGVWVWKKVKRPLPFAALLWVCSMGLAWLWVVGAGSKNIGAQLPRFNPILRLPEFLLGVCLASWQVHAKPKLSPLLSPVAILIFVAASPLLVRMPEVVVSNGLLAPVFAALILGLATQRGPVERLLSHPAIVTLGHASFAIYLLHLPILFYLSALTRSVPADNVPVYSHDAPGMLLIYCSLVLVCSTMSYRLIEQPGRRLILNAFNSSNRTFTLPVNRL